MTGSSLQQSVLANEQGRRVQLARFGYVAGQGVPDDGAVDAEWRILKADFTTLAQPDIPDLADLSADVRQMVEEHIMSRRQLDRLMEACDAVHLSIRDRGADAELVEIYAEARDAYEDAVEAFGERRVQLAKALEG